MLRKFYLLGFLVLGVGFITVGLLINNFENKKLPERTKSVLSLQTSPAETSIFSEKEVLVTERRAVVIKRVFDGDTVEIQTGEKIRYLGINAPEEGQPFFQEALDENQNLVLGKTVRLEFDIEQKDRYGRALVYVFVGDKFINEDLVKRGLAVTQAIQPNVKYQDQITEAQEHARSKCLGMWESLCETKTTTCIKIISINADAQGNDNTNKNGEWVEFKNICSEPVDMDGWLLKDSSSSNQYQFVRFVTAGGKTTRLYSGCGKDTEGSLYWQCPEGKYAIWNNNGDNVFLYNKKGAMVADYQY